MIVAYTYLIGWKHLNKWYYGSRYSKKLKIPEEDLWKKYFTSSKTVKYFRMQFGEPDVIEIRKTFNDKRKALKWETKILIKFNVCSNNCWLNISDNAGGINPPPIHSNRIWINKDLKNKRIQHTELNLYLKNGWKKGRNLFGNEFYKHGNRERDKQTGRFLRGKNGIKNKN